MRGEGGKVGLVPVNYIDKAENAKLENGPETQVNGKSEAEVSSEGYWSILMSVPPSLRLRNLL